MPKVADGYLKVDPWRVVEESFHPEQSRVSESIFALGNEYLGVRGYFEEGYSADRLVGSYCNGFYEETPIPQLSAYKGLISKARFMVNTVDWLFTQIIVNGETLDLAQSKISSFRRVLEFKTGTLSREFMWHTQSGDIKVVFSRFVSMAEPTLGCQRISLTPVDFRGTVVVESGLDFSPCHEERGKNYWNCVKSQQDKELTAVLGKTDSLGAYLFAGFQLQLNHTAKRCPVEREKCRGWELKLDLTGNGTVIIDKLVTIYAAKGEAVSEGEVWAKGIDLARSRQQLTFDTTWQSQAAYWKQVWKQSDIEIEGDPQNQQGIRFCIFQLYQSFHGANPGSSIGAKGLTGEAYNGHTFWDTETYCLPFYIFNNPQAARNLLEFRYRTLPQATARAKELDCQGAFYPVATIDGTESCGLWQHASLQLQVGSAVAYGIWHYTKICQDQQFLYSQGIEMLIEISRCYASRGQWSPRTGEFGFYGVMGPDEFKMMVNHNCYLNYMARKTFEITLDTLKQMESSCPERLAALQEKTGLAAAELSDWLKMAQKMRLPQDPETKVFEQHDGFFDLPHLEIGRIPVTDFPLYYNWSYDRIYRYDMIKQPDVLMFLFLFNQEFSEEIKRVNYDYYEPRCIHESSLSPSIHSILATELGYHQQAFALCQFATRLDLDNYNRNTGQGLHITSLAAAWMNIIYGFGGMRSDAEKLIFNPALPKAWAGYRFRLRYQDATLSVAVTGDGAEFKVLKGSAVSLKIYGDDYQVDQIGVKLDIPERYRG